MDYGQPVNNLGKESFFTPGVGDVAEEINPDKADSLNVDSYSIERDPRNVGNAAIFSPDQEASAQNPALGENLPELGQVTPLEMPPTAEPVTIDQPKQEAFNSEAIKTTETLGKSGIKEVDNILMKFRQDDDASSFYDTARSMMEKNMKNSYGELATWKGEDH